MLDPVAAARFVARIDRVHADAHRALAHVYGARTDSADLLDDLLEMALSAVVERPPALGQRDAGREVNPSGSSTRR